MYPGPGPARLQVGVESEVLVTPTDVRVPASCQLAAALIEPPTQLAGAAEPYQCLCPNILVLSNLLHGMELEQFSSLLWYVYNTSLVSCFFNSLDHD